MRYLGLSNVSADQVKRAQAVSPTAAVQYEYSLWRREVETELLPTLRTLGIAMVPWSPLGSGFLTGKTDPLNGQTDPLGADDFRRNNPRYSGGNLVTNRDRFAPLLEMASELGVTPAQLALAWLLHQGPDIIPIPGTRRPERVDENAKASTVTLDRRLLEKIDKIARPGLAEGATLL